MSVRSLLGRCVVVLGMVAPWIAAAAAPGQLIDDPADYSLRADGATVNAEPYLWAGARADGPYNAVYVFPMPVLRPGETFTRANFVSMTGAKVGAIDFNLDLYALGFQNSTTPLLTFLQSDVPELGAVKLQDNILTPASPENTVFETDATGDTNLRDFLNGFYAEAGGEYAGGSYLFLRLNPDAVPAGSPGYFELLSAEGDAATGDLPEPGIGSVLAGVGALAMGRRRRGMK